MESTIALLNGELERSLMEYNANKKILAETTGARADDGDASAQLEQRAIAEAALFRLNNKINNINAALRRAKEGIADECEDCTSIIPLKRVLLTQSTRCVGCQELVDQRRKHYA